MLAAMRQHPAGRQAALIGEVVAESAGRVMMRTAIGGLRAIEMLAGEQLPRIC
jgi:hydrogenase expression/formation protein HypE